MSNLHEEALTALSNDKEKAIGATEEPSSQIDAETLPEETSEETAEEELLRLRSELALLKEKLARKEREQARALAELEEFNLLFPEVSVKQVPESVWDHVKNGIPLSAAYALYEKKNVAAERLAERVNRKNASMSPGIAGKDTVGEYFSPDEVRAMSQKQVRENYTRILESMKSWG
ncbi:MAG: hypothetical protein IJY47_00230 [Clostridia bacterium]|nr:hypothetical protein [Clostridia bacterium]